MKARSLRRGLPLACIIASHARAGPFSSRFWQAGSMSLAVAGCAAGARGGGAPAEARAAATLAWAASFGASLDGSAASEAGRWAWAGPQCRARGVRWPLQRWLGRGRARGFAGAGIVRGSDRALALAAEQALQSRCRWHGGRPPVALAPTGRDTATSMWRRRTEVGNSFNLFKLL
jgi:hypothetical protein